MRRLSNIVLVVVTALGLTSLGLLATACLVGWPPEIVCTWPCEFCGRRAREAALKDNLHSMRSAIDNFHADKRRYPTSLDELVPNYIRRIPKDPITDSEHWIIVSDKDEAGTAEGGVIDVTSAAEGKTCDGVPYKEL